MFLDRTFKFVSCYSLPFLFYFLVWILLCVDRCVWVKIEKKKAALMPS